MPLFQFLCYIIFKYLFSYIFNSQNNYSKVHDSEGNQVSHSGVGAMSVLEKVVCDDLFPILSDGECNRIRSKMESI
ncbi:hypothetical protein M8C21_025807 [Ambrosia artemisiifolia]|uniref:Uncharacterized protein n=1 Tax=Ambrosia artemisiifolia TaxID=4212 RepID=A0AAD5BM15_AMBAR|nr:hypothetical protein M8C21_025807 [Ambrosia artemisiifolia]